MPGVTVEASSPALIENVRTVVTDSTGVYSTVTLPPGTYVVSFTLTGFNVVRRGGIELIGAFNGLFKVLSARDRGWNNPQGRVELLHGRGECMDHRAAGGARKCRLCGRTVIRTSAHPATSQ